MVRYINFDARINAENPAAYADLRKKARTLDESLRFGVSGDNGNGRLHLEIRGSDDLTVVYARPVSEKISIVRIFDNKRAVVNSAGPDKISIDIDNFLYVIDYNPKSAESGK